MANVLSTTENSVHEALCQVAEGVSDGEWRSVDLKRARAKLPHLSLIGWLAALDGLRTTGFLRGYSIDNTQVRDPAFQVVA